MGCQIALFSGPFEIVDGQSHIFASTIPNCISYDPTYSYEVAVIIHDGLRRMLKDQEDVFHGIAG